MMFSLTIGLSQLAPVSTQMQDLRDVILARIQPPEELDLLQRVESRVEEQLQFEIYVTLSSDRRLKNQNLLEGWPSQMNFQHRVAP